MSCIDVTTRIQCRWIGRNCNTRNYQLQYLTLWQSSLNLSKSVLIGKADIYIYIQADLLLSLFLSRSLMRNACTYILRQLNMHFCGYIYFVHSRTAYACTGVITICSLSKTGTDVDLWFIQYSVCPTQWFLSLSGNGITRCSRQ